MSKDNFVKVNPGSILNVPTLNTIFVEPCSPNNIFGYKMRQGLTTKFPETVKQFIGLDSNELGTGFIVWNQEENINLGCIINHFTGYPHQSISNFIEKTHAGIKNILHVASHYKNYEIHSSDLGFKIPFLVESLNRLIAKRDENVKWFVWDES